MGTFIPIANARDIVARKSVKSESEKKIEKAKNAGFPNCHGLYPDCPEKPTKDNKMCRNCPVLDKQ